MEPLPTPPSPKRVLKCSFYRFRKGITASKKQSWSRVQLSLAVLWWSRFYYTKIIVKLLYVKARWRVFSVAAKPNGNIHVSTGPGKKRTAWHRSRYLRSLIFTQTRRMLASEVLNHNDTLQMLKMLKGQSILIRCKWINIRCKINCKSSLF